MALNRFSFETLATKGNKLFTIRWTKVNMEGYLVMLVRQYMSKHKSLWKWFIARTQDWRRHMVAIFEEPDSGAADFNKRFKLMKVNLEQDQVS